MSTHTFHTPSFDEEFDLVEQEPEIQEISASSFYGNSSFSQNTNDMIDYSSPSSSTTSGDYHNNLVTSGNKTPETPDKSSSKEPVKPISPYASFFRDTVSAIQSENPDISFQEISKVVNSMWEALAANKKNTYKKKYEDERREYERAMLAYQSQNEDESNVVTISPQVYTTTDIPVAKVAPLPATTTSTAPSTASSTTNLATSNGNGDSTEDILSILSANICIRDGCGMTAITNPDWDGEYCSYDCVVVHTKTVFNKWVQGNQLTNACST